MGNEQGTCNNGKMNIKINRKRTRTRRINRTNKRKIQRN